MALSPLGDTCCQIPLEKELEVEGLGSFFPPFLVFLNGESLQPELSLTTSAWGCASGKELMRCKCRSFLHLHSVAACAGRRPSCEQTERGLLLGRPVWEAQVWIPVPGLLLNNFVLYKSLTVQALVFVKEPVLWRREVIPTERVPSVVSPPYELSRQAGVQVLCWIQSFMESFQTFILRALATEYHCGLEIKVEEEFMTWVLWPKQLEAGFVLHQNLACGSGGICGILQVGSGTLLKSVWFGMIGS